ncbi:MAG: hypothetical protein NTY46_07795 [Candidatus Sumerlaeota bacterium]|nr:hypothetical protein [Candidatus Sumerlaeota bacterium]
MAYSLTGLMAYSLTGLMAYSLTGLMAYSLTGFYGLRHGRTTSRTRGRNDFAVGSC